MRAALLTAFLASATILFAASSTSSSSAPYHIDPEHLWNRVFRTLYERHTSAGEPFGHGTVDPPHWYDSTYLLDCPRHQQTLELLTEIVVIRFDSCLCVAQLCGPTSNFAVQSL